jgi:hypothetical protein
VPDGDAPRAALSAARDSTRYTLMVVGAQRPSAYQLQDVICLSRTVSPGLPRKSLLRKTGGRVPASGGPRIPRTCWIESARDDCSNKHPVSSDYRRPTAKYANGPKGCTRKARTHTALGPLTWRDGRRAMSRNAAIVRTDSAAPAT